MKLLFFSVLLTAVLCQKLMAQTSVKTTSTIVGIETVGVDAENNFEILSIDSLEKVYVIYARRRDSTIKIVSIKDTMSACKAIIVKGGCYNLEIESLIGNIASPLHVGGVRFGDIIIKLEGNGVIWNLFGSKSLRGLCYVPVSN
jgi:hypothetical protein